MQSPELGEALKKREQVFLAAGATFRRTYTGGLYDVAPAGCPHPVYRYGAPLFWGVKQSWWTAG